MQTLKEIYKGVGYILFLILGLFVAPAAIITAPAFVAAYVVQHTISERWDGGAAILTGLLLAPAALAFAVAFARKYEPDCDSYDYC